MRTSAAKRTRKAILCGIASLLTANSLGGQQDDTLRALQRVEDGLKGGTVITTLMTSETKSYWETERCFILGEDLRVDRIVNYHPGQRLNNPTILISIWSKKQQISASIALRGEFADASAVFRKIDSKPAPEIRAVEGHMTITSPTLEVLGWYGSGWISEKLIQAGDGSIIQSGNVAELTWGKRLIFETKVRLANDAALISGIEYIPRADNHFFKTWRIEPKTPADDAISSYEKTSLTEDHIDQYRVDVLSVQHPHISDEVFALGFPEHSLINSVDDPDAVYQIVNGKRVKNYRAPKPDSTTSKFLPLAGLTLGIAAFFLSLLWMKRRRANAK